MQLRNLVTLLSMLAVIMANHAFASTTLARKGEGIYQLLKRNGLGRTDFDAFVKLNKTNLGPGNSLYLGREYELPKGDQPTFAIEPLLGKKYEKIDFIDRSLAGATYYLISGHGGPDPGAVARVAGRIVTEDEYAYDVTLRLGRRLIRHGASVYFIIQDPTQGIRDQRYLTSNKTEVCYPNLKIPSDQHDRLKQRSDAVNRLSKANSNSYERCVVIHVDARSKNQDIDIFFYHHESSGDGKRLATTMRNTVRSRYKANQPDRKYEGTVSSRGLYVINNIAPPVVFIELGNIHHARDQKRIFEPNNREAMANWLYQGLAADYKKSK